MRRSVCQFRSSPGSVGGRGLGGGLAHRQGRPWSWWASRSSAPGRFWRRPRPASNIRRWARSTEVQGATPLGMLVCVFGLVVLAGTMIFKRPPPRWVLIAGGLLLSVVTVLFIRTLVAGL